MCIYPYKIANIITIDPFKQFLWITDVGNKQVWSGQHTLAFFLLICGLSLTLIPFLPLYLLISISKLSFFGSQFSSEEPPVSWVSNKFLVLFFKSIALNLDICDRSSEFLACCWWDADGGSRKRAFLRPNMRGAPGTCRTVNLSVLLIGGYLFPVNYSE